ncbi:MAG: ribonuclease PH, partial [Thermoleophilia bacterium]|nr:ribonuclease PH [Thermoleophilia bacterium]
MSGPPTACCVIEWRTSTRTCRSSTRSADAIAAGPPTCVAVAGPAVVPAVSAIARAPCSLHVRTGSIDIVRRPSPAGRGISVTTPAETASAPHATAPVARPAGRAHDELRPARFTVGYVRNAYASTLVEFGGTRVLCAASVEEDVPRWMKGRGTGWVTAEYDMLPAATGERRRRDSRKGRLDGRTIEISRLIGRSLRAVVDFEALGERMMTIDCDVLDA